MTLDREYIYNVIPMVQHL